MKQEQQRRRCDAPIADYAADQTSASLRRLAFQVNRAARVMEADAVHDLRVSIRRFKQCLRTFRQFYPPGRRKEIKRELGALMRLALEVRDRDVALLLLAQAQIPSVSPLAQVLSDERTEAERRLASALKQWGPRNLHKKWHAKLKL